MIAKNGNTVPNTMANKVPLGLSKSYIGLSKKDYKNFFNATLNSLSAALSIKLNTLIQKTKA